MSHRLVSPVLRPRWRKVLADLWGNKMRSVLVIASITVGLFAVGMIVSMHVIITEDMETGYQMVNPANIQLFTSSYDEDLLDSLRDLPGVDRVEGVRIFNLRVRNAEGEWKPIEIKAIPAIGEMSLNQVRLVQGVWPPGDREIVVDQYKLDKLPVDVGGMLELELPSGKIRQMSLVGVVNDQTIGSTGPGGFFLAPIQGYITYNTLEWLETPPTLNRIYVTVDGEGKDVELLRDVANQVSEEVEKIGPLVYGTAVRATDDHPNRVYVQAISSVLILLGFLVMFLSAFLITNTLGALLNQQMHQIGVMKTIGARRGQIISIYMLLIFVYGLVAFFIALPLASRLAYALLEYLAGEINMTLQGYRLVPLMVIVQLIMALAVPQVAGFLPIWQGTRVSAVEALSGYSQQHPMDADSWLNRSLRRIKGISRPILLSLRNTFRRRGRLVLTLLTLTLGGAIFIATFNVQRSLANYIDRIGRYFLADVTLTLSDQYRIREIEYLLSQVPGVAHVEGWASASGEIIMPDGSLGESFAILAPPSASELVDPVLQEGRWIQSGDINAFVLNERFKEVFPKLKPGDTLQVKIRGNEREVLVVGFFKLAGRSSGYLAYTTYEYLSRQIHLANKANAFRVNGLKPGGGSLTLEEQEALGREIETYLQQHGIEVVEIDAGYSLTATTADGLNILTAFLLIMALLIAVVGSIGLAGTMSMNVLERTREIGIMRSIGASDRAVIGLVIVEGMLIGLMSWVFGVLLSFPISTLMSNSINLALFGAAADFTFTPTGVVLWLLMVLALSALSSVLPAHSAARLTIREVLAYE